MVLSNLGAFQAGPKGSGRALGIALTPAWPHEGGGTKNGWRGTCGDPEAVAKVANDLNYACSAVEYAARESRGGSPDRRRPGRFRPEEPCTKSCRRLHSDGHPHREERAQPVDPRGDLSSRSRGAHQEAVTSIHRPPPDIPFDLRFAPSSSADDPAEANKRLASSMRALQALAAECVPLTPNPASACLIPAP